jgi:hypothetical protein
MYILLLELLGIGATSDKPQQFFSEATIEHSLCGQKWENICKVEIPVAKLIWWIFRENRFTIISSSMFSLL